MKITSIIKNPVYLRFKEGKTHSTKELYPNLLLDLDVDGNLLGLEILQDFQLEESLDDLNARQNDESSLQ